MPNHLTWRAVFVAIALGLTAPSGVSWAQDPAPQGAIRDQTTSGSRLVLPQAATVQQAELILVPPDWAFRVRLSEAQLPHVGCGFETRRAASIESLIQTLQRSDIREVKAPGPNWEQEPQARIVLTPLVGPARRFLFGTSYLGQDQVRGAWFARPDGDAQPVQAGAGLPHALFAWVIDSDTPLRESTDTHSACERELAAFRSRHGHL